MEAEDRMTYYLHSWVPEDLTLTESFLVALCDRLAHLMEMQGRELVWGPYVRLGDDEDYADSERTPGLKLIVVECEVSEFDVQVGT